MHDGTSIIKAPIILDPFTGTKITLTFQHVPRKTLSDNYWIHTQIHLKIIPLYLQNTGTKTTNIKAHKKLLASVVRTQKVLFKKFNINYNHRELFPESNVKTLEDKNTNLSSTA